MRSGESGTDARRDSAVDPAALGKSGRQMIPAFGSGWVALLYKELLRFWKVSFQTIAAPILTSLLYLLIFSHVLESRVAVFGNQVRYSAFLVPEIGRAHV